MRVTERCVFQRKQITKHSEDSAWNSQKWEKHKFSGNVHKKSVKYVLIPVFDIHIFAFLIILCKFDIYVVWTWVKFKNCTILWNFSSKGRYSFLDVAQFQLSKHEANLVMSLRWQLEFILWQRIFSFVTQ